MRNATRSLAGAGTARAANAMTKAATRAGASTGKAAENLKAEARSQIDPLAARRPRWRKRTRPWRRRQRAQHDTEVTGGSRAPQTYEEYRDMPCLAHLDPVTGKSTHINRNCKWVNDLKNDPEAGYKRARKHRPRGKGGKGKNKDKEEDSSEAMDEDDNSPDPKAGSAECYALVVSPRIDGYDFSKCLMDGGASLNIMYLETLERMNLTKEQLKHSTTEFHGVVPGKKANSLGSITLPVAFGDVHNFREEKITFEVVPFKSSYHVIFGRPTYHKFHARACYIYNKLKIPGPKSRGGSDRDADHQEAISEKTSFKAAIETKKHDLVVGATYQRTMQRCLKDQIGRNVHAYVDDIAVMTRKGSDLISDLTKTFDNLRRLDKLRMQVLEPEPETWVMHFDGSKQHQGSGAGVTLKSPTGEELAEIGIKHIICCGDSDLVAQQVAGTWNARNSVMAAYRDEVDEIAKCFLGYEVKYVRRDDNAAADMLSKLGSGRSKFRLAFSWSTYGYPQLRALTRKIQR
ncbi:hypothetical protein QYE76_056637 [Lolium multiflorum]|uniref:RNase H type-1 domain-containing protein n=1 Tax=Lolium multiflorum TaxID=4521 RepID=A0AAD8T3Q8_LOLMU|nr:hypothetical protein QYE76_056637 [Lolium multiflorum]